MRLPTKAPAMTGGQLQELIIGKPGKNRAPGLAILLGWRTAHFRPGLTKSGQWRTAVGGDGKGFPDLVLVRERIIFVEIKGQHEAIRPDQRAWRAWILNANGEHYVWRPSDWDSGEIERVLRERRS